MREILFRGKDTETGEWLYSMTISRYYYNDVEVFSYYIYYIGHSYATIDAKTLGQYTGLTDKNGKKIFEGDIVKAKQGKAEDIATIGFENGVFMVYPVFGKIYERNVWEYWHNDWDLEVIGNIHDNPELLKGGADNG